MGAQRKAPMEPTSSGSPTSPRTPHLNFFVGGYCLQSSAPRSSAQALETISRNTKANFMRRTKATGVPHARSRVYTTGADNLSAFVRRGGRHWQKDPRA